MFTRFQWNAGGWFGGQIGGTVWLVVLGAFSLGHDLAVALAAFGAFAVVNAAGVVLWSLRDRMSAYAALQLLLGMLAIVTAGVLLLADARSAAGPGAVAPLGGSIPWWVLGVFPALMLLFFIGHLAGSESTAPPEGSDA